MKRAFRNDRWYALIVRDATARIDFPCDCTSSIVLHDSTKAVMEVKCFEGNVIVVVHELSAC